MQPPNGGLSLQTLQLLRELLLSQRLDLRAGDKEIAAVLDAKRELEVAIAKLQSDAKPVG